MGEEGGAQEELPWRWLSLHKLFQSQFLTEDGCFLQVFFAQQI